MTREISQDVVPIALEMLASARSAGAEDDEARRIAVELEVIDTPARRWLADWQEAIAVHNEAMNDVVAEILGGRLDPTGPDGRAAAYRVNVAYSRLMAVASRPPEYQPEEGDAR